MGSKKMKSLTIRLPDHLLTAVNAATEQRGVTHSELVRLALQALLELDPDTRRYATLVYEIAKTRSVLLRLLDTQLDKSQVNQLLALAEGDATKYVRERLGGDDGTP
jgi:metal-responsive CopG/Arc/MetJ family transcriptional regulator